MVRKPELLTSVIVVGLAAAIGVGSGLALGGAKGNAAVGLEPSR